MHVDKNIGNKLIDIINYILLACIAIVTVLPFIYIVIVSFTDPVELDRGGIIVFPHKWSLAAYNYIFSTNTLFKGLGVSVYITVVGTLINLFLTSMMAYPLAKKHFRPRKLILLGVVFTMIFSGGMIPTYFVVKNLGLTGSLWSLMIPTAVNAFNLIVLKNFFQAIPDGLEDSAKIDGCSDIGILFRIVIPLSLPAMATFALFYAVGHWNTFFSAILYINDNKMWPLQVWLRDIVISANSRVGDTSVDQTTINPLTIKMAAIVFTTVPILLVYPFLQKHFAKGVLLGSVKG